MSVDVEAWLRSLGLDEYAGAFTENDIDGDTLIELTDDDLKEIGIASVGQRRKLLSAIARLTETDAGPATSLQPATERFTRPAGERRHQRVAQVRDRQVHVRQVRLPQVRAEQRYSSKEP